MSAITRAPATELERLRAEAKTKPTDVLHEEFALGVRDLRSRLLQAGVALVELESRGETVDESANRHLVGLLRRIGRGELLVEAVVRFAGRPLTLAAIKSKPVEEQARLLGLDDSEVEEEVRTAPRKSPAVRHREAASAVRGPLPVEVARNGTPKDLAELCWEMVQANADPGAVAALLIPKLAQLVKGAA